MTFARRLLHAIAALCLLTAPALADTTAPPINGTTWTDIAPAGGTYEVQNVASVPVYLTTGTSLPSPTSAGTVLLPNDRICRATVTGDLYARGSGTVVVTTGLSCLGGGSSGGGGGTVNQGTPGPSNAPWPVSWTSQTVGITGTVLVQGVAGGTPQPVSGAPVTITSTETAVPATTSTQITTLTSRKFLSLTNDGVNPCRVSYGTAATASNGEPLAAAAAANGQGGARTFDASAVPQVAVYAYCTAASSFAVLEGQ